MRISFSRDVRGRVSMTSGYIFDGYRLPALKSIIFKDIISFISDPQTPQGGLKREFECCLEIKI
jgi:hypothetical protein